jgi:hypothetical protein
VIRAEKAGRLPALRIDYLEWLRDFAQSSSTADAPLRAAIDRAFWLNRHIRWYRLYRRAHAFAGRQRRLLASMVSRRGGDKRASSA